MLRRRPPERPTDTSTTAVVDIDVTVQSPNRKPETYPRLSLRTKNFYAKAIKQLTAWMVREKRLKHDPLLHVPMRKVDTDIRHDRRALTDEEFLKLVTVTERSHKSVEGMKCLVGLKRLWKLNLEGTAISDVGVKTLLQLSPLRDISLQRCSITDQSFAYFAQMQNLTRVRVAQTVVSDSGLEYLKGKTNLELLDLHDCDRVSDAGIEHLRGLTNLKELKIWGSQITNTSIEHLQGLSNLRVLSLQDCSVDDAGLEQLSSLTTLQDLTLFRTFVSDDGMQHVGKLTQLRRLNLRANVVGSEGLVHLKTLHNLERLDLSETIVGNKGLAHIKALPKLVDLNLWATRIGDDGMLHLAEMTTLRRLNLENVGFPGEGVSLTSYGVKQLEALQNLEWLSLGKTDVCDEGIAALGKLPKLAALDLNACQNVTSEGIANLRTSRPAIDIQRQPLTQD